MITMTGQHAPTAAPILEAIDTALAPARAISTAVEFQRATILATGAAIEAACSSKRMLAETIEAALYPQRLMAEMTRAAGFGVPAYRWCAVTPALPAFHAWTPVLMSAPLLDIAEQWRALVADLLRPAVRLAGEVARWLHAALLEAAEHAHAVLTTDPDIRRRKAAVEEFAVTWIGVGKQAPARREAILEAVEDVLLSACWRAPDDATDLTLRTRLRSRVHKEARWHRPIWDNQSRGYTIDLLERPLGRVAQGEPLTLAHQLVDPRDPYALLDSGLDAQQRLRQVLVLLKPEHRRVALQHAYNDGLTWQEAALLAGLPAEAGERARRAVRRRSRELQRRRLG